MILILGCGFLGSSAAAWLSKNSDIPVTATVRDLKNAPKLPGVAVVPCNLADPAAWDTLKAHIGDASVDVLYLAAAHNIDKVYEQPSAAAEINLAALERFYRTFDNVRRLIYASTDCVYGEGSPDTAFREDSPLAPLSVYGRQKLAAEEIVRCHGHTAARLPLMLGPTPSPKRGFYDNCVKRLQGGETVEMLDGFYRSALSYADAAAYLCELLLLPARLPGAVNVGGDALLSKYELGCRIAEHIGASCDQIVKLPAEAANRFYTDRRAFCARLDNALLKQLLGRETIDMTL